MYLANLHIFNELKTKKMNNFQEIIQSKTDEELFLILSSSQDYQPEFVDSVKNELKIRNIYTFKDFFRGKSDEIIIEYCAHSDIYPEKFVQHANIELIERNIFRNKSDEEIFEYYEQEKKGCDFNMMLIPHF